MSSKFGHDRSNRNSRKPSNLLFTGCNLPQRQWMTSECQIKRSRRRRGKRARVVCDWGGVRNRRARGCGSFASAAQGEELVGAWEEPSPRKKNQGGGLLQLVRKRRNGTKHSSSSGSSEAPPPKPAFPPKPRRPGFMKAPAQGAKSSTTRRRRKKKHKCNTVVTAHFSPSV